VNTKSIFRIVLAALIVLLCSTVGVRAQDQQETITVKSAEVNNGVVIITAKGDKAPIELQCNKDFIGCALLKPGEYVMVRLPKNRGVYECSNVRIYLKDHGAETPSDELGNYCINEK